MTSAPVTLATIQQGDTLQLYSVEQVAGLLTVDPSLVRRLANTGEIGHIRVGKRILFHRRDIMRYYRKNYKPVR
jgi:excisionase family DNA binding protein